MMNLRYKFSDTESTLVTEIPIGTVSYGVGFLFDQPFILLPKGELELRNGEWYLIPVTGDMDDAVLQSGMWKEAR